MWASNRLSTVLCEPPQGSLDMKYLQDRYSKGIDAMTDMLKTTQRFVAVQDLVEASQDVIMHANQTGGQSLLGFITMPHTD